MTPHDVDQRIYTTVLREMIRHEDNVTNHRIMWLLISQGLIANAYVGASAGSRMVATALAAVGILIALSAYLILYKSYQARGYLGFLGNAAKAGTLPESLLPLMGWPQRRVKDWRRNLWSTPWLGRAADLLEPYLFLPVLLLLAWFVVLGQHILVLERHWIILICALAALALLAVLSALWVKWEQRDEVESLPPPPA